MCRPFPPPAGELPLGHDARYTAVMVATEEHVFQPLAAHHLVRGTNKGTFTFVTVRRTPLPTYVRSLLLLLLLLLLPPPPPSPAVIAAVPSRAGEERGEENTAS
ncbi:hypothetical protein E2C01_086157 [Portunus trituberculatus]|uniref:Uncharacterized protein n=1 Tax=Portunus trituberculatus TaxID=210409 RepID=A0A5B7J317_PORTR|nr:hypothetical protein [Portunus trituberculatus]